MNIHQQTLLNELLHHEDLRDRLSAVVERGRHVPRFSVSDRSPENRVPGCTSSVWMISHFADGQCTFRSDADSHVVRGLVGLLADYFSGSTPAEIVAATEDPLDQLDLNRSLSPTRRHGLAAVLATIRRFARHNLPAPDGRPPA